MAIYVPSRQLLAPDLYLPGQKPLGGVEYKHGMCWLLNEDTTELSGADPAVISGMSYGVYDGQTVLVPGGSTAYLDSAAVPTPIYGFIIHFWLINKDISLGNGYTLIDFGTPVIAIGTHTTYLSDETITVSGNSTDKRAITETILKDQPHVIAVLWNGSNYDIWVDGRLPTMIKTAVDPGLITATDFRLKTRHYSSAPYIQTYSIQAITNPSTKLDGQLLSTNPYALLDPIGPEFAWVPGGGGVGYTLVAETGSYAYTGYDASLLFNRVLAADTGSYTYTGYDANLLYGYTLPAETGNYAYTGYDANFLYGYALQADTGTYTHTGYAASLLYGYNLQADTGSYAYTGFDANLVYTAGYTLIAETGSYSYTGYDVNLLANRILTAETGAYTYTGFDANLVYVSGYVLQAETGSYGYTGYDANLLADRALVAETGSYTYTGYDANLRKGFTLAADTGNYTYTGYDAGFAYNRVLAAETGSYAYTGYAASFVYSGTVRIVNFNTYILQIPDELVALQIMGNIKVIAASDATAAIQSNRHREHNRRH